MKVLKFVTNYFKCSKAKCVIYVLIYMLMWATDLIIPYVTGIYIDQIIYRKLIALTLTNLIISLVIIRLVSTYFRDVILNRLSNDVSLEIQSDAFTHIRKLPLIYLNTQDASYLTSKVNNGAFEMVSFVLYGFMELTCSILTIIVGLILVFKINKFIAIIFIASLPIYLILILIFKKPLYSASYKNQEARNYFFALLNNQILNIKLIKINVWFDLLEKEIRKAFKPLTNVFMKMQKLNISFSCLNDSIKEIVLIVLLLVGGKAIIDGNLTIGKFEILNTYFLLLVNAIGTIINFTPKYQNCSVAYKRLKEIFDYPVEPIGNTTLKNISYIKLNDVSFGYSNNLNIFTNFNYEFNKDKIYIIRGGNGKGKSTLINLILGLYNNYKGKILYNNINIQSLNLYDIRKNLICVTEQEFCLVNCSIKENITYGLNKYDKNFLIYLCTNFKFSEDFLNKTVSNQSDNLSGGQKQKISLIRTLLKSLYSDVIILDEPTSALDLESINFLKKILLKLKNDKIVLIITHDLQILDIADKTITIG